MRPASYLLGLATLAGVAGCAPANPPPIAKQQVAAGPGTILSMRTVNPAGRDPVRAVLLSDGGVRDAGNQPLVEFIVRANDGATLSIVQANEPGFRTGDRVILLHNDNTRLARPE